MADTGDGAELGGLAGAIGDLLADPGAMATIRGLLEAGRDLPGALRDAAAKHPEAVPAVESLLAHPEILDELGGLMAELLGGGGPVSREGEAGGRGPRGRLGGPSIPRTP